MLAWGHAIYLLCHLKGPDKEKFLKNFAPTPDKKMLLHAAY